jgi:protein-S-isoprenylcysteine O-methyltransferase Ste14
MVVVIIAGLVDSKYSGHIHKLNQLWEIFCLIVSFGGLTIRIFTVGYVPKGTSGRNTRKQVADALNTTGMYSIVRHPLYLGNFFIWLGISLFVQVWWVTLIFILIFWLYYERIMFAEEEFLRKKVGKEFLIWAEKTPAFLPKFKNWQPPSLSFSFKNALKREYSGFFAIIVSFTFLELISNIFAQGKLKLDLMWQIIFIAGLVIYLTVRILRKKTKILDVKGR